MLKIDGKLIPNPFNDPDPQKTRRALARLRNGKPITKEEFLAHMEELRRKKAERDSQNDDSANLSHSVIPSFSPTSYTSTPASATPAWDSLPYSVT
jgi:hypothetical protein